MQDPFVECSFVIPIRRDSDRQFHPAIDWRLLQEALANAGWSGPENVMGFRSLQLVPGGWVPEGASKPIEDESRRYVVAVPESRVEELRALLRRAGNTFDQRSIYLSVRGYVEFLVPTPEDGFLG